MASGMINSSYAILQEHCAKINGQLASVEKYYFGHHSGRMLSTVREQHERIRRIFSFQVVNKGASQPGPTPPDKEFRPDNENQALACNNEHVQFRA